MCSVLIDTDIEQERIVGMPAELSEQGPLGGSLWAMSRLRRKLSNDAGSPRHIPGQRCRSYRMSEPDPE